MGDFDFIDSGCPDLAQDFCICAVHIFRAIFLADGQKGGAFFSCIGDFVCISVCNGALVKHAEIVAVRLGKCHASQANTGVLADKVDFLALAGAVEIDDTVHYHGADGHGVGLVVCTHGKCGKRAVFKYLQSRMAAGLAVFPPHGLYGHGTPAFWCGLMREVYHKLDFDASVLTPENRCATMQKEENMI